MENPFDPREPGPFTARVRAPQRRGADYHLPPIGNGRTVDKKHFRREHWTARFMLVLFLWLPLAYVIGLQFDVW